MDHQVTPWWRAANVPNAQLLGWAAVALAPILLTLVWDMEEPSPWHTLTTLVVVTALAYGAVALAQRLGAVHAKLPWMLVFAGKLVATVFIVKYLWLAPLGPMARADHFTDPAVYDYYGALLADAGLSPGAIEGLARGNTTGVIWYIAIIYFVFGKSTLYVGLFNCVLTLVAFLSLAGLLSTISDSLRWQLARFGMLLPEIAYYDAIPAKEAISVVFLMLSLWFLARLLKSIGPAWVNSVGLLVGFAGVVLIRPTLLAVITGASLIYLLWIRRVDKRVLIAVGAAAAAFFVILPLVAPGVGAFFTEQLSLDGRLGAAQKSLATNPSIDPKRNIIHKLLLPEDAWSAFWTAPIRTALVLVGPYPDLLPDMSRVWHEGGSEYAVWIQEFAQKLSAAVIISLGAAVAAALFDREVRARPEVKLVLAAFLVGALVVPQAFLLVNLRYRIMLDPLILGVALIGIELGRPQRFARPWAILVVIGLVSYYVLSFILSFG